MTLSFQKEEMIINVNKFRRAITIIGGSFKTTLEKIVTITLLFAYHLTTPEKNHKLFH